MSQPKLSTLAANLLPSEIVRLSGTIKEKISAGAKIYNYTIGDFDSKVFPIPQLLQDEIIRAYKEGFTTYPAADGEAVLRKAVSDFITRELGTNFSESEVLISCGGRPLIYSIFKTIIDEGDKVVYPIPSWNNNHYTNLTHGQHVPVIATAQNNFLPTAAQLKPLLKDATLLALCSPLNPTGTAFTKEELEAICDLVIEENKTRQGKKLYVMYDQMYWTLTFGEVKHYHPVGLREEMRPYTIYVDGISKSLAATGVRVGWALGPANVLAKMRGLNSHIGSWAPMAEQHAVANTISNEAGYHAYMTGFKKELEQRLVKFYNGFSSLKEKGYPVDCIAPQAAIYLTVKIDLAGKSLNGNVLTTQEEVTEFLLNEANIALVPFNCFGAEKDNPWYRLSIGTTRLEDIDAVMKNLEHALSKLS